MLIASSNHELFDRKEVSLVIHGIVFGLVGLCMSGCNVQCNKFFSIFFYIFICKAEKCKKIAENFHKCQLLQLVYGFYYNLPILCTEQ